MTTYFDFQESQAGPFQFQPTLDGTVYTAIVTWNTFGQRYYLNLYTPDSILVLCIPVIGSPLDYDISLIAGYFTTSTLIYRQANSQFEVNP